MLIKHLSVFVVLALILGSCATAPPKPSLGSISGGAYLLYDDGTSEILRGMQIFLCRPEAIPSLEANDSFNQLLDSETSQIKPRLMEDVTEAFDTQLAATQVSSIPTDVDGKFEFKKVPQGKYCLAALVKVRGRYSKFQHLFWLMPITVSDQDVKVDLSNTNAAAAGNTWTWE